MIKMTKFNIQLTGQCHLHTYYFSVALLPHIQRSHDYRLIKINLIKYPFLWQQECFWYSFGCFHIDTTSSLYCLSSESRFNLFVRKLINFSPWKQLLSYCNLCKIKPITNIPVHFLLIFFMCVYFTSIRGRENL